MFKANPSPETLNRLNISDNAAKLLWMYQNSQRHCIVHGCSGSGKTLVGKALSVAINAHYLCFDELSEAEWEARFNEIFTQILTGSQKVVIVDGFIRPRDIRAYEAMLQSIAANGIRLILLTQLAPVATDDSDRQALLSFNRGGASRYPVQFTEIIH